MPVILQTRLPEQQTGAPRLPGTGPCGAEDWLLMDEAYAPQMAYREALLAERPEAVFYQSETAKPAASELLEHALALLPRFGFGIDTKAVVCPDGRKVMLDRSQPLWTLAHLVQEDLCILQKRGDEHVLNAAALCFPANWRLADKIEQPLTAIHSPVAEYNADIARRVQRLFNGVRAGRPLWRFNKLRYADADLHQPRRRETGSDMPFTRSERQCILRLPESDAVVFTIHTYVVRDGDTVA